jgi:two-component system, sensor histidine kinase and response regulator
MQAEEKVNILLVDDIPAKMLALESVLSDLGQNVIKARSGREALRMILRYEFAVILLDVNMPGLDGFETASLIRQRKTSEDTPIIFITAINTGETHVARGYSLGAVDYIFTPIIPEVLKAKVGVFVNLCKANARLKRQALELARSNKELEQFAYVASHDLQEPLRMISAYTQLLSKKYSNDLDKEAMEFMGFTVNGVSRMQALVSDLLEYSRVGRGNKELMPIDCDDILENVLNTFGTKIEESKAVITHELLPNVVGDELQFFQLFQNLIGNALKFRGDRDPRIAISAEEEGDYWIFSVKDNGIGIESNYSDRIFLIFQRLHSHDAYPGTGIGLAICKKIVEHHGGKIWFESQPGVGSTFYFTIPRLKNVCMLNSELLGEKVIISSRNGDEKSQSIAAARHA